ncbi:helix-turn-helix domain-containing protein [Methylobacterium sp. Leaf466]|uniref:helix-turn-helix domain-containing protein n=1 Tax=Methylobacterium sp. Leaf466 TaxID=1736386 RepID=UPI000A960AAA|nr:helix-turn-helix domain-containing protein [Methylobacterium sp. Leaf466]
MFDTSRVQDSLTPSPTWTASVDEGLVLHRGLTTTRPLPAKTARAVSRDPHDAAGIVSCITPSSADRSTSSRRAATKRDEILAFIAAQATCPDLTPERIARRTGVSRTVLYRILEPLGGVATCVQRQRLHLMRGALAHRGDARSIKTIAHASGFRSVTHASRSFHKAFGMPPGSYRQAGLAG